MIGKALIRQSNKERLRVQLAKRILEQSDRVRSRVPTIEPIEELKLEEKEMMEGAVRLQEKERYIKRVHKEAGKKYQKYWERYDGSNGKDKLNR